MIIDFQCFVAAVLDVLMCTTSFDTAHLFVCAKR